MEIFETNETRGATVPFSEVKHQHAPLICLINSISDSKITSFINILTNITQSEGSRVPDNNSYNFNTRGSGEPVSLP